MTTEAKTEIEYWDDGKTIHSVFSIDESGNFDGPFEEYYPNGTLWRKGSIIKDENEKELSDKLYKGLYEEYNEDGSLLKMCVYSEDGKVTDGPYVDYGPGGKGKGRIHNGEFIPERKVQRQGLNARLKQINKQMAPTPLRRIVKQSEVAEYRKKYPKTYKYR